MNTADINGITYSIGKLDAFQQLHVARKLAPFLAHLFPMLAKLAPQAEGSADLGDVLMELAAGPLADIFCRMAKEDVDFVVNTCLSVCQRKQDTGYKKIFANGSLMFNDIQLDTLVSLTLAVVQENLGRFFLTSQPESPKAE